jgi:hypothetical protein
MPLHVSSTRAHRQEKGITSGSLSAIPRAQNSKKGGRGAKSSTPKNWGAKAPGKKKIELVALFA